MKVTLVHGEDSIASRNRLNKIIETLKKRDWDLVELKPKSTELLSQRVSTSNSLFSVKTLYLLYDFNSLKPQDIESLSNLPKSLDSNLLFWQDGVASSKLINNLPKNSNIEVFEIPKTIFIFLDSFYPGNANVCLKFMHQTIETQPVEMVFAVFAKYLRDLYWSTIPNSDLNLPAWRLTKLRKLAARFDQEKLKNYLMEISDIDVNSKMGGGQMMTLLDLFIVRALE